MILSLCNLFLAPVAVPQDFEIIPIVRTGDPAPDGNGVFDRPVLNAVINEAGQVAFAARTIGSVNGILDDDILVLADENGWSIRGREGAPAAGGEGVYGTAFPTNPFISSFTQPSFTDLGEAISVVGILGAPNVSPATGLVSAKIGSPTQLIIREGLFYNGGSRRVSEIFVGFGTSNSSSNATLLMNVFENEGAPVKGMWNCRIGSIQPILSIGSFVAEGALVVNYHEAWPVMNESGTSVFVAGLMPGSGSTPDGALIRNDNGQLTIIARENAESPNGGNWGDLDFSAGATRPVINSAGQIAFAAVAGGSAPLFAGKKLGVYLAEPDGTLQLVMEKGDASPDGTDTVLSLIGSDLGPSGDLAFIASLGTTGVPTQNVGIIAGKPGALEVIARTGQDFPSGTDKFGIGINPPQVNAVGTVAFIMTGESTLQGSLFAKRKGEPLIEIAIAGQPFDGKIVSSVSQQGYKDPGGHSFINGSDEIVFKVGFENGDTGIYIARLCQAGGPSGICNSLRGTTAAVSISKGGSAGFLLEAGTENAGSIYFMLGTSSGISPSFSTPPLTIPLNTPDPYFNFTINNFNSPILKKTFGSLNGMGSATASFNLAPGQASGVAGLVLHHAYIVLNPIDGALEFVSNPSPVTLLP